MKVAIQGVKASFHDVASKKFFKGQELELVECSSFPLLFQTLNDKKVDYAVMAIENALAGSILPNYALMEKYKFKIVGEVYLKIEMCLLGLPGEKLEDIRVVQSHPMALLQCMEFLTKLSNVKLVEHADTAESAFEIKSKNLVHHAAIASSLAAETYGLNIIQSNIETHRANFTRFLILSREEDYIPKPSANKASLCFQVEHKPGSLFKILTIFDKHNVNMSKIHSLHVMGRPYHFAFHVDLEWIDPQKYHDALKELEASALSLIHFGDYEAGEKPVL
jgi:prephenate dehydratase